ncbi:MAG: hypothetical protein RIR01_2301 [Bacteroidota bacterium]|jgi:hypothetical protein
MMGKTKLCNGCQRDKYIYKNVTIDGVRCRFCKECALNPKVNITLTPTQIKKKSDKKVIEDRLYSILRKKHMEEFPLCQAKLPVCTNVAVDIHHTAKRGVNTNNVSTWISVCRACHNWIHFVDPAQARELGLLK